MDNGYVQIYQPEHPQARDSYVYEHRLVMERMIGRLLDPDEIVHHENEIKDDNDPANLVLFASQSEHMAYHAAKRGGTTS